MFAVPQDKILVEFKAGRMTTNGTRLTPDKRKGLIQVTQSAEGLVHFKWKDRSNGNVEEDFVLFDGDATFSRIKQCTTGRVALLEFGESGKKEFFWLQDLKEDNDAGHISQINKHLNPSKPTSPSTSAAHPLPATTTTTAAAGSTNSSTPLSIQQPIVSTLASNNTNNTSATTTDTLQRLLAGMPSVPPQARLQDPMHLLTVLPSEQIIPLFQDPEVQQRLIPYLPEGRKTVQELLDTISSPQFQQAVRTFSSALSSGQLVQLMKEFGLDANAAMGVESFLNAIQKQEEKK